MGAESRIRVGIFFNARQEQGGLYQYALTIVDCLARYAPKHEYVLYRATLENLPLDIQLSNWKIVDLPKRALKLRMGLELALFYLSKVSIHIPFGLIPTYSTIDDDHVDLMIYVKPTPHVYQWRYPAIFPIHDLQHRLQRQFPEVSEKGEFNRREILYTNSIKHTQAILTDSETGKADVMNLYGANGEMIYTLPYIAPTFRDAGGNPFSIIKQMYQLPDEYFFYPAAFWPHKNHARLIEAIKVLEEQYQVQVCLVLSGSKKREYDNLVLLADKLGIKERVRFIGFVDEDDLLAIYKHALALVMPTFFGPTNIPILEAWQADCPVITSNLRGIREQVGDAGLLVDPLNAQEIADAMWRLSTHPELRQQLIDKGKNQIQAWTPALFGRRLAEIIRLTYQKINQ